jgi:hypothetical protein
VTQAGEPPNENSGSLYNESSGSRLIISNALVLSGPEGLELLSQKETNLEVLVYPACDKLVAARGETNKAKSPLKSMSAWTISLPAVEPELELFRADDRHFGCGHPNCNWTKSAMFICASITGATALSA